ncbi:MAG: DUF547 domain-containing protein [bacterium]
MYKFTTIFSLIFFLHLSLWVSGHANPYFMSAKNDGHKLFDLALGKHVKDGLVDYAAIAKDKNYQQYLAWLAKADVDSMQSKEDEMAFWINAYNALVIKGVVDSYPLEKVPDVIGFFTKNKHAVAGGHYTLDQIEKEILFKKFKQPKLHFVLVCAAKSCPNLPAEAYTDATVLNKIEEITRSFLNNPQKNRLDQKKKIFYLSQIFNWYRTDFITDEQSLLQFILPYLDKKKQTFLAKNQVQIEYLEYDWHLNRQK